MCYGLMGFFPVVKKKKKKKKIQHHNIIRTNLYLWGHKVGYGISVTQETRTPHQFPTGIGSMGKHRWPV